MLTLFILGYYVTGSRAGFHFPRVTQRADPRNSGSYSRRRSHPLGPGQSYIPLSCHYHVPVSPWNPALLRGPACYSSPWQDTRRRIIRFVLNPSPGRT
jgi:hypothetical protein